MGDISERIRKMGERARRAAAAWAQDGAERRTARMLAMAEALRASAETIVDANAEDIRAAKEGGRSKAFLDRLLLTPDRVKAMATGMEKVASLHDPIGDVDGGWTGRAGIRIEKVRVPLGVVGIIYEARPNVTSDAAALAVRTANAVILRGSKDALTSNRAIVAALRQGIEHTGGAPDVVQLLDEASREASRAMMRAHGSIDVLIPRGSAGLIRSCVEEATVPVIETGAGNCHLYVDQAADIKMAVAIAVNAKTQRPSTCNTIETLLVHEAIAERALPALAAALTAEAVTLHADAKSLEILRANGQTESVVPATEDDYAEEYLDLELAVKVVADVDEAMAHIARYGTRHSETIVTQDLETARRFREAVDAACVYLNTSSRFTDGEMFGFGAELGISTQKLHARGPMGPEVLTTYKYVIESPGTVRP